MAEPITIRRALISVYDKTGIVEFARALRAEFGTEILSTGGTAKVLAEAGIPVTLVESITGFPEILGGRVKTLHPAIFAAILAERDNPAHMRQLAEHGIEPIDMVVVNLYPFEQAVADPACTFEQAIEMIDIGGVALLRAAAKNHRHVLVPTLPDELGRLLVWLREHALSGEGWEVVRRDYASSALELASRYDAAIANWLTRGTCNALHFRTVEELRYGENPHQTATVRETPEAVHPSRGRPWGGSGRSASVSMSYNNYLDADAALALCAELTRAGMWHRFPTGGLWHRFSTGGSRAGPSPNPVAPPISREQWTRRNLPHLQVPGATYFVTFRTRPLESGGALKLSPPERDIVLTACTYWHSKKLTLHCACVMPDHVHLLLTPHQARPSQSVSLGEILHSIKRHSAYEINRLRRRRGPVWLDESFDRVMRNEREFIETWEYIEANPLTAGVVETLPYKWFWRSDAGFQETLQAHRLETGATETGATETGATESGHRLETGATGTGFTKTRAIGKQPLGSGVVETHVPSAACCCFIKHANPCGVGVAGDPLEAYRRAYLGDPSAAMGGTLACNFDVDADFAATVMETYERFAKPLRQAGAAHASATPHAPGGFFVEVWIAPRFTDDAVALIRGTYDPATAPREPGEAPVISPPRKKWGQNVRLLAVGDMSAEPDPGELVYRSIAGGMLVQTPDLLGLNEEQWKVVTKRAPTEREMADLRLAWLICKHTKSNAITIVRDGMLLGNGAGQMSRVMSCRVAVWLAQENGHLMAGTGRQAAGTRERGAASQEQGTGNRIEGPVAASDAFFPFRDGPDLLLDAGVTAIIQPGGSKRDAETIAACDERGAAMIFTGTRHFRH